MCINNSAGMNDNDTDVDLFDGELGHTEFKMEAILTPVKRSPMMSHFKQSPLMSHFTMEDGTFGCFIWIGNHNKNATFLRHMYEN